MPLPRMRRRSTKLKSLIKNMYKNRLRRSNQALASDKRSPLKSLLKKTGARRETEMPDERKQEPCVEQRSSSVCGSRWRKMIGKPCRRRGRPTTARENASRVPRILIKVNLQAGNANVALTKTRLKREISSSSINRCVLVQLHVKQSEAQLQTWCKM